MADALPETPIPGDVLERVQGAGWLVPSPHRPFAQGGGARVYRCFKHALVAGLEQFAESAAPQIGKRAGATTNLGCQAVELLHRTLVVDKSAVAVLKVPKPEVGSALRARREIEAMKALTDPCLARLLASDPNDPARWMVMQYYPRGSISDSVDTYAGNPVQVLRGALEVARALVKVHQVPLVHRDIKPSNIFLGDGGEWVLGDFGIALADDHTRLTNPGDSLWSRDWMPDWMVDRPDATATPVVDIYMLVLSAFFMMTRRKPRVSQLGEGDHQWSSLLPRVNDAQRNALAAFFSEHLVHRERDVVSQSAADLCQRLERLLAFLDERTTYAPLLNFISTYSTTDVGPGGRAFSALVMNPRASKRFAVSVRAVVDGQGPPLVRLLFGKQERPIPIGPDGVWSMQEGFDLGTLVPEGPVEIQARPSGCVMSGLMVWAA